MYVVKSFILTFTFWGYILLGMSARVKPQGQGDGILPQSFNGRFAQSSRRISRSIP